MLSVRSYHHPQFGDEKAEAWIGEETYPPSPCWGVAAHLYSESHQWPSPVLEG